MKRPLTPVQKAEAARMSAYLPYKDIAKALGVPIAAVREYLNKEKTQ